MATAGLRTRSTRPPARPGQIQSLSPISQRRLRTLPLPFDCTTDSPASHSPASHSHSTASYSPASEESPKPSSQASTALTPTVASTESPTAAAHPRPASTLAQQAQRALVAQLSRDVQRIEVAGRVQPRQLGRHNAVFSTGCGSIDGCLPCGGYESGSIIEYLQNSAGSGATTLALNAAREALAATDRFCVVIDWRQQFYPPAAAALGLDLKRLVIVRPQSLADRLWAIDQALRSPSIIAVIAEVEQLDDRAARRLQLAAESGGSLGLLVRNVHQRHQPSWAEIQWLVRPISRPTTHSPTIHAAVPAPHRQLQLELLRVRGGHSGSRVHLQVNALNGRIEPATAAATALARTLARTQPPTERRQPVPRIG